MTGADATSSPTGDTERPDSLRLWPGVLVVAVQWLTCFGLPAFDAAVAGVLAGALGGLLVLAWWGFFSRARASDRWLALGLWVGALVGMPPLVLHESIATGMQGLMFPFWAMPGLSLAFVVWAVVTRNLSDGIRRATMAATVLIACGGWALVRTGGFTGADIDHDLAWRWSPTAEERLLAAGEDEPVAGSRTTDGATEGAYGSAAWPGFRGPGRDGVVRGVRIDPDWSVSPPDLSWRRAIGPGWSSFAVRGPRVYTQEQRGDDEVVSCYDLTTGQTVWRHGDAARFWESNAGAGPRGTPTYAEGRVYTLGATGLLNALDADDGTVVWSRDAADDTGAELPDWAFAGSPLVVGDLVVVGTAGALVAYDRATGERRWSGPTSGGGYSSPQLFTIDGVEQVLFASAGGVTSVRPDDGTPLWEHAWPGEPIVQPALAGDGELLVSVSMGSGVRRLGVARDGTGWTVTERWTSIWLKPYYNDLVVHEGHAYGFDGGILACIDLAAGERQWKGGRYGRGQVLLLADQDLLLALSERGEVALVDAVPAGFTERGRFEALEGKTWNHPVLVEDVLLVRNAEEMAAFRLALLRE